MRAARASMVASIVALVAAAALVVRPVAWAEPPPPDSPCTIKGTLGPDVLTGTAGSDVICAFAGDDQVSGGGGDDLIFGGAGADTLNGGPGNDDVRGGPGVDVLLGYAGDDELAGGPEADDLDGGIGADLLVGAGGDDVLKGGADDDEVRGTAGADLIHGWTGDDRLYGGDGDDEIRGQAGLDLLAGSAGADLIIGGDDADVVYGGDGDDDLFGSAGDDNIHDRDGSGFVDDVSCGDGSDAANVDLIDVVNADCEIERALDREDPVAVDDAATVTEDDPATAIDVLANDTDADGGPRSVGAVTQPAHGTVAITGGGTGLTYAPDADYCNDPPGPADTFTYTLAPGGSTATVSVTVTCVADPAVPVDDAATVAEDAPATAIDVLANDTGVDGKTITSVTQPADGTVVITGGGTGLTYEPDANFCGTDTFTYTVVPGGASATVTVTVTCVDDPPTAVDDAATVAEDSGATSIDVLANDTDSDGGPKTIGSVTQPAHGIVVVGDGGADLSYEPTADYCNDPPGAPDTFTYTLDPGGSTATVSMTVTCVTDPAVAVDDSFTVTEDASATTFDVLANDTGADGKSITSVTQPPNGMVVITGGGSALTYEPSANYCGPDAFDYTVAPGGATATVTVTVTCTDDPPTAVDDAATVVEDSLEDDNQIDVLANDTDVDGGPIAIDWVTQPDNGTVAITGGGTGLTYQPNANYCNNPPGFVLDTFDYTLTPGGDTATVHVTVTCVDDPPTAVNDAATVLEDAAATAIAVLANDTDVDGGPQTIASASDPASGTVVITGGGTGLTYQPDPNYCNDPPGTTPDTFDYTLNGGSTATVSITVTCVNDAPIADDETFSGASAAVGNTVLVTNDPTDGAPPESGPHKSISGDLLAGDTDVDGPGPLTITGGTFASNDGGTVALQADGDFVFTPAAAISCTDTSDFFDYTVNDGDGGTDTGRVTVAITGCVWYVDNNDPAGNSGTSSAPFDTLTQAETASGANHTIFVFDGDNTSTGYGGNGLALKAGQRLIGEHIGLVVGSDTLHPANPGAFPTLTATDADVVDLDDGTTVSGFVIDPQGTGGGIAGGSGDTGGGTIADVQITDTGAAGTQPGLELDTTTGTFNVSNLTVSSSGATGVRLNNAGTVSFAATGTISVTTTGAKALDLVSTNLGTSVFDSVTVTGSGTGAVTLTSTTGTVNFAGLDLATTSGSDGAFVLSNAAGVTVPASATATVSSNGGRVVDAVASGAVLNFDSISSTNTANGVRLQLGVGTFDADAGSIQGGFDVGGGSGDITFDGSIVDGTSFSVNVVSRTAGTVAFTGTVADGADAGGGIIIANNTGGSTVFSGASKTLNTGNLSAFSMTASNGHTVSFTGGGLDIDTTSGAGFSASDSGTVVVSGTGNTIDSGSGRALSVVTTDIGAADLTFQRISAIGGGSGSNGIVLDTTGSAGNLVVTGNGGTCTTADTSGCSGGTISGFQGVDDSSTLPGGTGIVLRNTTAPSFTRIRINGGGIDLDNYAIRGTNVSGLTLAESVIDGQTGSNALTLYKDGALRFEELTGTVDVTNTSVSGGYFTNVMVDNTAGTLNATFDNVDSLALDSVGGDDAVQFEGIGTSDMNVVYRNSAFTTASGDLFQYIGDGTGGGDLDLVNNTFTNNEPTIFTGGGGLAVAAGANGPATLDILNNTMRDSLTNALTVIKTADVAGGTNNLVANITGNTIGVAGDANSGSLDGDGMEISTFGDGNATFTVTNNAVHQYNSSGMQFTAGSGQVGTGQFNLDVSGNTVANPGSNPLITLLQGVRVDSGVNVNDTFSSCVKFGPNSITGSSDAANKDFRLVASQMTTLRQPGYAGGATDGVAFATYAASLIGGGAQGTAVANSPATFSGGGTTCP